MEARSILVIEDNELNLELVVAALELKQWQVLQAADAETGIKLARAHRPDLILMDIQLPGMDGFAATRLIKADPTTKDIPIVALTAHAMRADREQALRAGCSGYITKPYSLAALIDEVERYLSRS